MPLLDLALAVDHHADARRALLRIGVGAVGGADRPVGVADEREVEVELLGELLVVGDAVEGRAEDDGVLAVIVGFQVAEPATLGCSARSVSFRVEPEHDRLALEVRQLHDVAVVVAPREIGRLISRVEHEPSLSVSAHDLGGEGLERVPVGCPIRNAMLSRVQSSAGLVHHLAGVLHGTTQISAAVGTVASVEVAATSVARYHHVRSLDHRVGLIPDSQA